jgi:predicted acyl esterase
VSRAVAVVGGVLGLWFVLVPLAMGIVMAHKWREPVGSPPGARYRDVAFRASDGVRLRGWYRPARNGTAVVIAHGGGSDRRGGVRHARMLARHGYGVLLYDARGRGESEGAPNDYGWGWAKDLDAAIDWLQRRPDAKQVAGLGLSTGADVLLDVAGRRGDLAAVITDGAAAGSFEDVHRVYGTNLDTPSAWLMFTALRVVSADPPGHAIEDELRRLRSPALLISAGTSMERDFNRHYDDVGGPQVEHWNLPGADHTRGVRQAPEAYERRVTEFLRRATG